MTKRVLLYFALLLWFVVPVTAQPTIFVEDLTVDSGTNTAVDVKVSGFEEIVGMQFSVNWDHTQLQFDSVSIVDEELLPQYSTLSGFGYTMTDAGKLTTLYVEPSLTGVTIEESATIFRIHFQVIGQPGDTSSILISNDPVNIELSNGAGQVIETDTESGMVTVLGTNNVRDLDLHSNPAFAVYQNEPNPFISQTQINFEVRDASNFDFEVYDVKGKLIYSESAFYSVGLQSIIITREKLNTEGVYFYTLKTKDYLITNRMILVR